jgi:STE24 endopeptidase
MMRAARESSQSLQDPIFQSLTAFLRDIGTEVDTMTYLRFALKFPACLRTISSKTSLACIAGVLLAPIIVHAELPVAVPETTAAALARMRHGNIHWAAYEFLALAIPLLVLFSGLGARLRRICESISGHRWFWTVTLFGSAYLVLAALIAMPFEFYLDYVQPHAAGWSQQTFPNWLKGEGVQLAVRMVVVALLIWLPYRLIAKSPRRWWLYGALLLFPFAFLGLVALPVWVKPLTTSYKPLEDGPLKTRIETMAARCGVNNIPVLVGGNSTGVDGLGPTNRIYLQTNLASVESPDQIEFTIGHELKHYVMGDNWKALAIIAAFLLGGFWLTDRLGRAAIRRFSSRWGFSELSDPASLPLMIFLFLFLWLAILPFFNLFARHIEMEADRFGLELTHENRADALIFVRDAQVDLAPDWGTFFLIFRADHPSIRERIEFANNYKPWEHGAPMRYGKVCKPE